MSNQDFSITRQECLDLLDVMGISIPLDSQSKLTDEAVDKKLKQALDASQNVDALLPAPPSRIKIDALRSWPAARKTSEAVQRTNVQEVLLPRVTHSGEL